MASHCLHVVGCHQCSDTNIIYNPAHRRWQATWDRERRRWQRTHPSVQWCDSTIHDRLLEQAPPESLPCPMCTEGRAEEVVGNLVNLAKVALAQAEAAIEQYRDGQDNAADEQRGLAIESFACVSSVAYHAARMIDTERRTRALTTQCVPEYSRTGDANQVDPVLRLLA